MISSECSVSIWYLIPFLEVLFGTFLLLITELWLCDPIEPCN